jgi:hypothetical protein
MINGIVCLVFIVDHHCLNHLNVVPWSWWCSNQLPHFVLRHLQNPLCSCSLRVEHNFPNWSVDAFMAPWDYLSVSGFGNVIYFCIMISLVPTQVKYNCICNGKGVNHYVARTSWSIVHFLQCGLNVLASCSNLEWKCFRPIQHDIVMIVFWNSSYSLLVPTEDLDVGLF